MRRRMMMERIRDCDGYLQGKQANYYQSLLVLVLLVLLLLLLLLLQLQLLKFAAL